MKKQPHQAQNPIKHQAQRLMTHLQARQTHKQHTWQFHNFPLPCEGGQRGRVSKHARDNTKPKNL